MLEAFSFNREYDYVRLDGLSRATGRSAHEWDLYILKELIDNALDADESLWSRDTQQHPSINIQMAYVKLADRQQLLVEVRNRAIFPVDQIEAIFDTRLYTSRKAFIKRLTRGALGNALKTILGIPYSLHKRSAEEDEEGLQLKPLSISCNGIEYLPRYILDSTAQTIQFACEKEPCETSEGTIIRVGLDYFVQEIPRKLSDIQLLAQQYHLCNPHADFTWEIEIDDREEPWKEKFAAHPGWTNKFREMAPVQWYSVIAFKELLGALYREKAQGINANGHVLPVRLICQYFPGLSDGSFSQDQESPAIASITKILKSDSLTSDDINGQNARELYQALSRYTDLIDAAKLGYIGVEHIREVLAKVFPLEGELQYGVVTESGRDTNSGTPFVIEVVAARLKGSKRQIWTAINFSPTYSDPFQNRWLYTNMQPDDPALGLRNLMNIYHFPEDEPIILFLHLISPTIEHIEFSKTEINHLPFEKALNAVLDKVLTELRQANEEEQLRLKQVVYQALDAILEMLDQNERFILTQLEERVLLHLGHQPELTSWLERPDSIKRVRTHIANYQNDHPDINKYLAPRTESMMFIPSHPEHYISVPIEDSLRNRLAQNYVNKIIYVQPQELETVFLANNWLCQMDMALFHAPMEIDRLREALINCLHRSDLPILILHKGDKEGYSLVEQMHTWLKHEELDNERIVDLMGNKQINHQDTIQPAKLMPRELANWLLNRFSAFNISVKFMPSSFQIRQDIHNQFERFLQSELSNDIGERLGLLHLITDLEIKLSIPQMMLEVALDEQLKGSLKQPASTTSYATMVEAVVGTFFERFMDQNLAKVREIVREWLVEKQSG